jgi:tetratricopeptide (TPR) repeat protein
LTGSGPSRSFRDTGSPIETLSPEAFTATGAIAQVFDADTTHDDPDTLNSMNNLATVLRKAGRWDESYELLADAAKAARRSLPPDSVLTGGIISNYGVTLIEIGRYPEAERALLEAGNIFERALGPDHRLVKTNDERLEELYARWRR